MIAEDIQSCLPSFTFLTQGHKSYACILKDICSREWVLASKPSSVGAYALLTFSPLHMPTMPQTGLHLVRLYHGPGRSQLKGKGVMLKSLQYLCHHPPKKHHINPMPKYVSRGLKAWHKSVYRCWRQKGLLILELHKAEGTKLYAFQTIHRQWGELSPESHLYSFQKKTVVSC